jgi:hypothetical protein
VTTLRENLLDMSEVAGSRLPARVQGLTDDEYFGQQEAAKYLAGLQP